MKDKHVLVTTKHRGVFAGELAEENGLKGDGHGTRTTFHCACCGCDARLTRSPAADARVLCADCAARESREHVRDTYHETDDGYRPAHPCDGGYVEDVDGDY